MTDDEARDAMECIYWGALEQLDPDKLYKLDWGNAAELDADETGVEDLQEGYASWVWMQMDNSPCSAKDAAKSIGAWLVDHGVAVPPLWTKAHTKLCQLMGAVLAGMYKEVTDDDAV